MFCKSQFEVGFGTNQLAGTIPSSIGKLSSLRYLYLQNNRFSGRVPEEIFNVESLELMWINDNMLTWTLPNTSNSMKSLKFVDVSNNLFHGSIPSIFFNTTSIIQLNLQNNDLTGTVPDDQCDNIGKVFHTSYPKLETNNIPWFAETIGDLQVDNSEWFDAEPKVDCSCCSTSSCYLWDISNTKISAQCPSTNIVSFRYFKTYEMTDISADVKAFKMIGQMTGEAQACLSPTGCYNISFFEDVDMKQDLSLGYSSSSQSLMQYSGCDAVDICGVSIAWNDPKRKKLNHITQLVASDMTFLSDPRLPEYKALCWIMSADTMYDDYEVCDGSLLQRYVMIYMYYATEMATDFEELAFQHTCEWPGIVCGSSNRYVERLELSGKNLVGSLVSEIGLLTRLKGIDLSDNMLTGSIDPVIFAYLPYLEVFDVGSNNLEGEVPQDLFLLPHVKSVRLSNNKFFGNLPSDIVYSKNIGEYMNRLKAQPELICLFSL